MTILVLKVATDAGKDQVYELMADRLGDRRWNRGDSGAQGAWYVSTVGGAGAVKIWGFEEEPGAIYVDLRDDTPDLPEGDGAAWRRDHLRRVVSAALELGDPLTADPALVPVLDELGRPAPETAGEQDPGSERRPPDRP